VLGKIISSLYKTKMGLHRIPPGEMECMATSYFQSVYTRDPSIQPTPIVDLFQEVISEDTNEYLCKPFLVKEVSDALFQVGPLKSPGPDGFPVRFYQRNWDVLKDDIIQGVLKFFESGVMPIGFNDTSIVLIPKVDHPKELKDFRPISFAMCCIRLSLNAWSIVLDLYLVILFQKIKVPLSRGA
jgi:hypothetical protein